MTRTRLGALILSVGLIAVLLATLVPGGSDETSSTFACVFCGERALADLLVNVILFTPVGIGVALAGAGLRRAVLAGLVLSALVEVIQLVLPGRDASLGDVIANTVGAWIGAWVVLLAPWWLGPRRSAARGLALAWALLTCGLFWLTGWLLTPSFPATMYFAQWTPNLGHLEWYRGRIVEATVDGRDIHAGRVREGPDLRRALREGRPVVVEVIAGPGTKRLASIFSINDERQREIVLVGPDRQDLVFRYRTRASDFRLDQPDLRLRSVMGAVVPGDSLRIAVERRDGGYCMGLQSPERCRLGHTVADGWSLLFYAESFPEWLGWFLGVCWLAALAFPLGLWARGRLEVAVVLALLAVALLIAPTMSILLATAWTGWVAAGAGVAIGLRARSALAASSGVSA
jgi:hypothetical protein